MERTGSPSHRPANAGATTGSSYPTHQKNSTWDAFMWSSKLQLPSLGGEPLSPGLATTSGTVGMPTHRRGASMPPNLDDDDANGLPPIRYDDLVQGDRPRLGHRTRGTLNSFGTMSDWNGLDNDSSKEMLVAEPPPTHRRGGSIPMASSTLGGLDLYGTDGLFGASSSGMQISSTSAPNSAMPKHRRSVTFQGTTSTHSADLFDLDSLKQAMPSHDSPGPVITPPRTTTPPPPSQTKTMVIPPPAPPPPMMMQQQQHQMPPGYSPYVNQPPPMAQYAAGGYGHTNSAYGAYGHHEYDRNQNPGAAGGMGTGQLDPAVQMQLQMQQALLVQQQQWLLAMQQQQLQQQQQMRSSGGRGGSNQGGPSSSGGGSYYASQMVAPPGGSAFLMPGVVTSPPQGIVSPPSHSHSHHPHANQHNGSSSPGRHNYQQQHGGGKGNNNGSNNSGATSSAAVSSDPVLAEYKSTGMRPRVEDLRGHVSEFALDAHGSRFLQYQMEIARAEDKDMLVSESLSSAVSLMQDTFGNYVVQNFLEHATPHSRRLLGDTMKGSMLALSLQPHGCRVVQRALDLVEVDQRNELLTELLVLPGNVSQAAKNTHATHVLQKTVSILRRDSALEERGDSRVRGSIDLMRAMEKAIADDVIDLLLHPHSYRLVLNVLSDCDPSKSPHIKRAIDTVAASRELLSVDQHGNFMLQHMLDNKQADNVLDFVQERLVELSQHKFGSHLVEKCFAVASPDRCSRLVEELLRPSSERNISATKKLKAQQNDSGEDWGKAESPALALMKDPYANFVVQKAFDRIAQGALKQELTTLVQAHAELLQKFTYGRHILAHVLSSKGGNAPGGINPGNNNSGSSSPSRNSPSSSPAHGGPRGGFYARGGGRGQQQQHRG